MAYSPIDLEGFLKIFTFDKKRDLEKYCKDVKINQSDFVAFIKSCKINPTLFRYKMHKHDQVPKHLEITESTFEPISKNGVGPLNKEAKKSVKKISQFLIDRRYMVSHAFFNPNNDEWHLFYFDQRDMGQKNNHWEGGSHIHYISWLWPHHDFKKVWDDLRKKNETPKDGLHICFIIPD